MDKEEIARLRPLYWNLPGIQDLFDALSAAKSEAESLNAVLLEINSVVQSEKFAYIKSNLIAKITDFNRQLSELHEEKASMQARLSAVVVENAALKSQLEEKTKEANIHWEDSNRYRNSMNHWRRVALEQEGKL